MAGSLDFPPIQMPCSVPRNIGVLGVTDLTDLTVVACSSGGYFINIEERAIK